MARPDEIELQQQQAAAGLPISTLSPLKSNVPQLNLAPPPPVVQQPQVVDRVLYLQQQRQAMEEARQAIENEERLYQSYIRGEGIPRLSQDAVRFGQGIMQSIPEYERGAILNAATSNSRLREAYQNNVVMPVDPGEESFYQWGYTQTEPRAAQHELTHAVWFEQMSPAQRQDFIATVLAMAERDPKVKQIVESRRAANPGADIDPTHIYTYFGDISGWDPAFIPPELRRFYAGPPTGNIPREVPPIDDPLARVRAAQQLTQPIKSFTDKAEAFADRRNVYVVAYGYDPANPATWQKAEQAAIAEANRRYEAGIKDVRVRYPNDDQTLTQGVAQGLAGLGRVNTRIGQELGLPRIEQAAVNAAGAIAPYLGRSGLGGGVRSSEEQEGIARAITGAGIPTTGAGLALELLPGIGFVPGGASALRKAIKEAGFDLSVDGVAKFFASDAGKPFWRALTQGEEGFLKLGRGADEVVPVADEAVEKAPPTPVEKLRSTLTNANVLREAQEVGYSAERARRAAALRETLAAGDASPETVQAALSTLKGELPKERLDVADQFTPQEVNDLLNEIKVSEAVPLGPRPYDNLRAQTALMDMLLNGRVPQRSEIDLLGKVFGKEVRDVLLSKRPINNKLGDLAIDILNIPQTMLTSFDISWPLRQGAIFAASHPMRWAEMWRPMLKALVSEGAAQRIDDALLNHPEFQHFLDVGGYKAPLEGGEAVAREETMISNIARRFPGVAQASRAFITAGNWARFEWWQALRKGMETTPEEDRFFAQFVNYGTGRGAVPDNFGQLVPGINAFFSARNFFSRPQALLQPFRPARNVRPMARIRTGGDMVKFVGAGMTALAILKLNGADVELDPRSSDFGKGRFGSHRIDFWAGFQQQARYMAQLITGQAKSGDDVYDKPRMDSLIGFLRNKLSPPASLATNIITGENAIGEPVNRDPANLRREAFNTLTPFTAQAIVDAARLDGPLAGALAGAASITGMGVQSYEPSDFQSALKEIRANIEAAGEQVALRNGQLSFDFMNDKWNRAFASELGIETEGLTYPEIKERYIAERAADKYADDPPAEAKRKAESDFEAFPIQNAYEKERQRIEGEYWRSHPDDYEKALNAGLTDAAKYKVEE